MEREIKIFRSFEEQEEYSLEQMRKTTPAERFKNLLKMQALTKRFHPVVVKSREIIIHKNGYPQ